MTKRPFTIDFETAAIQKRPEYPPKPAGVSIWHPETGEPKYYAWGHPSGNNCTFSEARNALVAAWDHEMLFHNGKFDVDVATTHMQLPWPKDPLAVHDTMFLLYLYDPHADSLSLKPSAARILNLPQTEKDDLDLWLKARNLKPGADIAKAPGDVVAPYANGDTFRTRKLFESLLDHVNKAGMLPAYRREQKLMPILVANERDGVRIDVDRLAQHTERFETVMIACNREIQSVIGACNLDSSAELARALIQSGTCKESDFLRTPTGKMSTAKLSMDQAVKNPALRQLLGYRGHLKTLLTTFMRPWLEIQSGGWIHPEFNQVRGDVYGTRTGRLSSSNPNLQNVPTEFKGAPPAGLPTLPFMRQYILPDEGDVLVSLDFASQEFRIAAHFAEGRAAEIYRNDPRADFHAEVKKLILADAGLDLDRKLVKITGFSLLYGSGINSLAELLQVDRATASNIRHHYFQALPGMKKLMDDVSARGRAGSSVKTWGGRVIYSEPSKVVKGRQMEFSYKLVNYLIQGSAADQTKEAINTAGYKTDGYRFMATVHDENVYSVKPDQLKNSIAILRDAMENQPGWDVPWKTTVEFGPNWHDLEEYK